MVKRLNGYLTKITDQGTDEAIAGTFVAAHDYDALMEECVAAMKRNGEYLKALHAVDDYWHGPGNTTHGEASDAVRAALFPQAPPSPPG